VKIEPPDGASSRRIPPFFEDRPHPDRSLHFWHYNVGKRSVVLDLQPALLARLVRTFDVVLSAGAPADLAARGALDGAALRAVNPSLVLVTITPFGLDGPWRDRPATDLTLMALGGAMAACGYGPDTPPLACGGWQAFQTAGVYAVHGLMGAVLARDAGAPGQDVEVSIHEAATSITEWHVPHYRFAGQVSPRAVLGLQFQARDGCWVSTIVPEFFGPHVLPRLVELLAADGLDAAVRDAAAGGADGAHPRCARGVLRAPRCRRDLSRGTAAGFPVGPDPHAGREPRRRAPPRPRLLGPGAPSRARPRSPLRGGPFIMPASPWRFARRPPLLGEHTDEVLAEVGAS
jgi:crotonobetainyl-CoA:carnitine CoA-transferase CaiB-like acyl-CoA transferase